MLLCCSVTTRAQDASALTRADAAYARGALLEASRAYEAALREPGHDREALVRIHLRLGVTSIARRQERAAQEHFRAALALDPTLSAPAELAPDARARFEALRPPPDPVVPEPPVETTRAQTGTEAATETGTATESGTATSTATETETETATETATATATETATGTAGGHETALGTEQGNVESTTPPGLILTLEQCLADPVCANDSPRRCAFPGGCIVEPPHRDPEWFEHPIFWGVLGIVVVGAAAGGTAGYLVTNPPGYVLAAPEVR